MPAIDERRSGRRHRFVYGYNSNFETPSIGIAKARTVLVPTGLQTAALLRPDSSRPFMLLLETIPLLPHTSQPSLHTKTHIKIHNGATRLTWRAGPPTCTSLGLASSSWSHALCPGRGVQRKTTAGLWHSSSIQVRAQGRETA